MSSSAVEVSADVARRFILGKQGLWPGRRWAGKDGTRAAMCAMEHLQLDPLVIVARSHDLVLHARVADYEPAMFHDLTYRDREFFDWGGWLAVRPMDELPYWRVLMRRSRIHRSTGAILQNHPEVVEEMRALLASGRTVSSRELEATGTEKGKTYRGTKARSLALYYLWRTGEAMTHHRDGFERVYAATRAVAPAHLISEVAEDEAERFLARKSVSADGIGRLASVNALIYQAPAKELRRMEEDLIDRGDLAPVFVAGWKGQRLVVPEDLPLLEEVASGRVPGEWSPPGALSTEEVVFLSPLDPVVARGRAKELFGFDHVWEIYKKPEEVRFGRFTMPILFGEQLVGRMDARLDRKTSTLVVNGLWLEDVPLASNSDLARALVAGTGSLATFLAAKSVEASTVTDWEVRKTLTAARPV